MTPEARPLVDWLKKHGEPVTRENYLRLAYPAGLPTPWTIEHEQELPPELQRTGTALKFGYGQ